MFMNINQLVLALLQIAIMKINITSKFGLKKLEINIPKH